MLAPRRFPCPKCQTRLEVPATLPEERLIECPNCGETFRQRSVAGDSGAGQTEIPWQEGRTRSSVMSRVGVAIVACIVALLGVGAAVAAIVYFEAPAPRSTDSNVAGPGMKGKGPGGMMGKFKGMPKKKAPFKNFKKGNPNAAGGAGDPKASRRHEPGSPALTATDSDRSLRLQDAGMPGEVVHGRLQTVAGVGFDLAPGGLFLRGADFHQQPAAGG
jgi:hypothetical protein